MRTYKYKCQLLGERDMLLSLQAWLVLHPCHLSTPSLVFHCHSVIYPIATIFSSNYLWNILAVMDTYLTKEEKAIAECIYYYTTPSSSCCTRPHMFVWDGQWPSRVRPWPTSGVTINSWCDFLYCDLLLAMVNIHLPRQHATSVVGGPLVAQWWQPPAPVGH